MLKEKLLKLRKEHSLSQADMAKLLNITRQAYNHYETGVRVPTPDGINQIADIFGVSTDYLLRNTDIKSKSPVNNCELVNEDDNLTEYLELLRTRPELKMMFQLAKGATKKDVELATKIIEAMLSDK